MLDFGKTSYKDLVFARGEFLRFFGDPNESLRLIIIYYMLKFHVWEQNNFARFTKESLKPVKGSISPEAVIRT